MILNNSSGMGEHERVSPFLSNTAFGAEIAGGLTGWHYGRKVKAAQKSLDLLNKPVTVSRAGSYTSNISSSAHLRRLPLKEAITKNKAIASSFRRPAALLGWGSIFSIGIEAGEAIFDKSTSYHSAQRARRLAVSGGAGETMYYDTRAAATMRQRALQVIHNSQLSTRAAFGNEASYFHN